MCMCVCVCVSEAWGEYLADGGELDIPGEVVTEVPHFRGVSDQYFLLISWGAVRCVCVCVCVCVCACVCV